MTYVANDPISKKVNFKEDYVKNLIRKNII